MSHPVALPLTSVRLPRMKFKRPRWPKGSRYYFALAVGWTLLTITSATRYVATSEASITSTEIVVLEALGATLHWCNWKRSRNDDDGPQAT